MDPTPIAPGLPLNLLLQVLPSLLALGLVLVVPWIASMTLQRWLRNAGLSALERSGHLQWTPLLGGSVYLTLLFTGLTWWTTDTTTSRIFMSLCLWGMGITSAVLILAGAGWYTASRQMSERDEDEHREELRWVRLSAGGLAAVAVSGISGFMTLWIVLLVAVAWLLSDDGRRGQIQSLWRRWTAGNTLRSLVSEGQSIQHDGRELTFLGRPGLLSCDFLADEGLVTLRNDDVLLRVRALEQRER